MLYKPTYRMLWYNVNKNVFHTNIFLDNCAYLLFTLGKHILVLPIIALVGRECDQSLIAAGR